MKRGPGWQFCRRPERNQLEWNRGERFPGGGCQEKINRKPGIFREASLTCFRGKLERLMIGTNKTVNKKVTIINQRKIHFYEKRRNGVLA